MILPEVYVSLLYNDMVQDNLSVVVHEAEKFICLGTPDDYEQYKFWWKYFHEKQDILVDLSQEGLSKKNQENLIKR